MRKLWEILTLLQTLPTGSLISKRIRGYIRYYHQYYENARRIQKYIRKADEPHMLQQLQLRRQLLSELRALQLNRQERQALRRWRKQERERKKAQERLRKRPHPERCVHYASWGEYVRSKSEILIGLLLERRRIPFRYEKGLELGRKRIHPDFTFYAGGKEYYWEHLGLWEDESYRRNWEERKALYEQYGIEEGRELLCTKETGGGIDMVELERQLEAFLRK